MFNLPFIANNGQNGPLNISGQTNPTSGSQDPQDIPKEELLSLCMKLNKKLQFLESKGKELSKKKALTLQERQKLLNLLETIFSTSFDISPETEIDFTKVDSIYNKWNQEKNDKISSLETKIQTLSLSERFFEIAKPIDECDPIKPSSDVIQNLLNETQMQLSKYQLEIDQLQTTKQLLSSQLANSESTNQEKAITISSLQKELETLKNTFEDKTLNFQMQFNQSKKTEEAKQLEIQTLNQKLLHFQKIKEEKEILMESNKEMIVSLQSRLLEIEPEYLACKEKAKESERHIQALNLLKIEKDSLINSLQKDIKLILDEKDSFLKKLKDLEENKLKNEGQSTKISNLTEEINKLKVEIEEKSSLVNRLRSEIQVNERNHAMRTAMLATCEAQLEVLQTDITKKNEEIFALNEKINQLEGTISHLETRIIERNEEFNQTVNTLETKLISEKTIHENSLDQLKRQYEENIEIMKKDFNKKSSMARQLLSEREEEVRILTSKVNELQEEISSGAPTERKIFEIAKHQSQRDAFNGLHRDTRELAFQQLQGKLASKDLELAQAQQKLFELNSEVIDLRKVKQREGLNMDYLKNIILQYMTFPINSSERQSLVPVIGMLLQFNSNEINEVMKAMRDPQWGSRPIKSVKKLDFAGLPKTIAPPFPPISKPLQPPSEAITTYTPPQMDSFSKSDLKIDSGIIKYVSSQENTPQKSLSRDSEMSNSDLDLLKSLEKAREQMNDLSISCDEIEHHMLMSDLKTISPSKSL